jgi:solute carrier family 25 aspartate/glutamate transporter 12/13
MSNSGDNSTVRANRDDLLTVFEKYADFVDEKSKEKFITGRNFITKFVGIQVAPDADQSTLSFLSGIVDTNKNGLISFDEFCAFERMLTAPDAIYVLAFRLFDSDGSGYVSFDEFRRVYQKTLVHQRIPFNFDCEFVKLHFGSNCKKELSYVEFTQFLQSVQEEHAKQAFQSRDTNTWVHHACRPQGNHVPYSDTYSHALRC